MSGLSRRSAILMALATASFLAIPASRAQAVDGNMLTSGGLTVYLGVMPAEIVKGHPGHRNNRTAEVLSSFSEGDRVVLHPSDRVKDGIPVSERENR